MVLAKYIYDGAAVRIRYNSTVRLKDVNVLVEYRYTPVPPIQLRINLQLNSGTLREAAQVEK